MAGQPVHAGHEVQVARRLHHTDGAGRVEARWRELQSGGRHEAAEGRGEPAANAGRERIVTCRADVTSQPSVEAAFAATLQAFGKVDILVNNAGMSPLTPSSNATPEDLFDKVIDVNFKGPFRLTALIGPRMVEGDGGVVLNISSVGAIRPSPAFGPYSGAKAALNALTTAFAIEYAPKVRVNCIMAGPFLTDIANAWTEEAREKSNNSMGRPGRPEEIVTTALYLASPASSFVTGAVVRVDGGDS